MEGWVIWLVAACILGIGEMHQGGFYLLPFAAGAGLAAVVSLLGVGGRLAGRLFVACSVIGVAASRRGAPPPRAAARDPHRRGRAGGTTRHGPRANRQRRGRRLRKDRRRRG